jgi:alkylation response protein AidB-like acyl-CoA dehydrogenase
VTFLLFEQFGLEQLLGKAPYANWGKDEVTAVIEQAYDWVRQYLGPYTSSGDAEGCKLVDGQVHVPHGFKEAWKALYEAGWRTLAVEEKFGGQQGPFSLAMMVEEFMCGSNTSFNMYPALTQGAAEVIIAFGTDEQKDRYVGKMFDGSWAGTMCLTEPQAGSDVGASRTTATRNEDGSYAIRGTKIFISGGDQDLTENIVHLVLARVDGAPAGTKGLTLFIVPKHRTGADGALTGPNDVTLGGIEHKMGINGSATCVLNFGESGACIGWPVGGDAKLNQGMAQMFRMMNGARIAVGVQGISVASSAFLNALEYAKDRKQGSSITHWKDATAPRVSILEHADVRRMLLDMKSRVEGIRALAIKLARHQDAARLAAGQDEAVAAYNQGQVDLLVPLVKAYGSDQAFRICEEAIQTYGGVGYTRDYPVEQYCRDAKIFSVYEGTNHIQAMDLVGRKLGQAGGQNLQNFLGDIAKFIKANKDHATLGPSIKVLASAQEAVAGCAMRMLMWFQTGNMTMVPLYATRYLEMMAETAVGWLLLEGAVLAEEKAKTVVAGHPDANFYKGKTHAAVYFAKNVLPAVADKAKLLSDEDKSALEIPDEAFATV